MYKKIIVISLLEVLFLLGISYFYINYQNKKESNQSVINNVEEGLRTEEYIENYIDFIRDKSSYPVSLQNLEEDESKIFIEKLNEVRLAPTNILKTGNEIYFVSIVDKKNEGNGKALFLYDIIMRKFRELYFYKEEEQNANISFTLGAIDVIGNKLIVILKDKELECSSLWLEQGNNFYIFDLSNNGKDGLIKYNIPKWKIEEEKLKYPNCRM